jgi:hypothetical protein
MVRYYVTQFVVNKICLRCTYDSIPYLFWSYTNAFSYHPLIPYSIKFIQLAFTERSAYEGLIPSAARGFTVFCFSACQLQASRCCQVLKQRNFIYLHYYMGLLCHKYGWNSQLFNNSTRSFSITTNTWSRASSIHLTSSRSISQGFGYRQSPSAILQLIIFGFSNSFPYRNSVCTSSLPRRP